MQNPSHRQARARGAHLFPPASPIPGLEAEPGAETGSCEATMSEDSTSRDYRTQPGQRSPSPKKCKPLRQHMEAAGGRGTDRQMEQKCPRRTWNDTVVVEGLDCQKSCRGLGREVSRRGGCPRGLT